LNNDVIVSPPIDVECLFDYWKNGVNKRGHIIRASSHRLGTEFDIGGRGGEDHTVDDEVSIVRFAMADCPGIGIRDITVERQNNCLHVSCFNRKEVA
jgi:hypothetical protein